MSGLCGGVSRTAARISIIRVTDAILEFKDEYLRMPSMVDRDRVAREYFERFGIPKLAFGVDGMHASGQACPHSTTKVLEQKTMLFPQRAGNQ